MKNVLEWLEQTAKKKIGLFSDNQRTSTIYETMIIAKKIGSFFADKKLFKKPIVILIDKNCNCVDAMMGALYAGCYYVVIDVHSPLDRIRMILESLSEAVLFADKQMESIARKFEKKYPCYFYENISNFSINETALSRIREQMVDLDTAYILFTSGSTGKPKGTVISHRSLISYINWISDEFKFDKNTVFGSQTPLYFSMSVSDLYSTIKCGCSFYMIPKKFFSFPLNLIQYLNEKKINTIYWVPTAISLLSNWKAFQVQKPQYLRKVLFAGEVMPMKQLNYWIQNLSNVQYANLFGPTETVDICTFYVVDREFKDDESLPIGKHCDNCHVMIIKENGTEAEFGEEGELFVRSSFVADGYYNNSEKTSLSFVQNPLNPFYPEIVYKTGDIVKYNEYGELIYISRKDFQIKRSGYRIELGEIETACNSMETIKGCACVYQKEIDCLVLFYEGGSKDESDVYEVVKQKVPSYMLPDKIVRVLELPKNANGKIDRIQLTKNIKK